SAARTFTTRGEPRRPAAARAVRAMDTKISGGSTETEVNELTVTPRGDPSRSYVTTVTPVTNRPTLRRRCRDSMIAPGALSVRVSPEVLMCDTCGDFCPLPSGVKRFGADEVER